MPAENTIFIPPEMSGQTLAACIKRLGGEHSWSEVKKLVAQRHIKVNGTLCLDETRRMKPGDLVAIAGRAAAPVPRASAVDIAYLDDHLVVVEKPPGIQTVRRHEEMNFSPEKKRVQPTLDEVVTKMLAGTRREIGAGLLRSNGMPSRAVRVVHRLDRDTSGLMLFARSTAAEAALVKKFSEHEIKRVYTAVVHGRIEKGCSIDNWLLRDRGDGLRGSVRPGQLTSGTGEAAQRAVTHLKPLQQLQDEAGNSYTRIECRLETGRTHQIRIHLAESGHRLCGEKVYVRPEIGGTTPEDHSGAPRHALHSCELQLSHPVTGKPLQFKSPLPKDLASWLAGMW